MVCKFLSCFEWTQPILDFNPTNIQYLLVTAIYVLCDVHFSHFIKYLNKFFADIDPRK